MCVVIDTFTLELFVCFVILINCGLLFIMFEDRTTYSPRNMELTGNFPDNKGNTIPAVHCHDGLTTPEVRSPVRRNLLSSFDESTRTPLGSSTQIETEAEMKQTAFTEVPVSSWSKFTTIWIGIIIMCVGSAIALYHYFPGYMLLCLTKEFLCTGVLGLLCALLVSVIIKLLSSSRRSTGMKGEPNESMVHQLRFSPTTRSDYTEDGRPGLHDTSMKFATQSVSGHQLNIKRTFSGDGKDIWSEFRRYFENICEINGWNNERKRRVFFTVLRDQAETYAYGLSDVERNDWDLLTAAMNNRFGHHAMKESYISEAKLRKKNQSESFRDFGQAVEDLYRRAYPNNREFVQESSMKTFMDNCSSNEDFRLAVKRMRPKTLQEAVTVAMQEECIRLTESKANRDQRMNRPQVYRVSDSGPNNGPTQRNGSDRKCFICLSSEHLARACPQRYYPSNSGRDRQHVPDNSSNGGRTRNQMPQTHGRNQLNEQRPRQ